MKAVVIGSVVLDVIVSDVEYLARQNYNKHEAHGINLHAGGGALNVASHLAALGTQVSLCASIGDDHEARAIINCLHEHGVDTSLVETQTGDMTGKSVVILLPNKEVTVYVNRAANKSLSLTSLTSLAVFNWVYATSMPSPAFKRLMSLKKETAPDSRLVMNPGMRQLQDPAFAQQIIEHVDLLCINYEEARALCETLGATLNGDQDSPEYLAQILMTQGLRALLMTLGAEGALYQDPSCRVVQGVEPINLVSTIGAGDAFCATFAFYWTKNVPVEEALEQARQASAQILEKVAANHLNSLDDVL